jgi:hypothetical protein
MSAVPPVATEIVRRGERRKASCRSEDILAECGGNHAAVGGLKRILRTRKCIPK